MTLATNPRIWTYESLRAAQPWIPIDGQTGGLDRDRIGAVMLPHFDPEHGEGFVSPSSPTRRGLASWLFGPIAILPDFANRYPERGALVEEFFGQLVALDELRRRARDLAIGSAQRREAAARAREVRDELARHFAAGLERREGDYVTEVENVFIALASRDLSHDRLRVCEQCAGSLQHHGRSDVPAAAGVR